MHKRRSGNERPHLPASPSEEGILNILLEENSQMHHSFSTLNEINKTQTENELRYRFPADPEDLCGARIDCLSSIKLQ